MTTFGLRDSEIDWAGDIPAHWRVLPLFAHCVEQKERNLGNRQSNVLSLSYGRIVRRDVSANFGLLPESFETYCVVSPGDVVLRLTDLQNDRTSLRVGFVSERGIITSAYVTLRAGEALEPAYLFYLLHAYDVWKVFYAFGGGVRQSMKYEDLRRLPLVVPPRAEQRSIVSFLNGKTVAVDATIGKKERLVELLQERRKALIAQGVTKGLGRAASLRQSGVAWIGEVPVHWRCMRLKFVCRLETGHTPSKSDIENWIPEECVIPWVSLNDTKTLGSQDYISDTTIKISRRGMDNSSAHMIDAGAVVFNRDGARIGLAAITTRPMAVSQHIIAWVCGPSLLNEYLLLVLYAMEDELYRLTAGATIPTIGMGDVKELICPVPPLAEQQAIVAHLNRERAKIADTLTLIERQCAVLKEYRQALITAAVTGKLDVRGRADYALPPDPVAQEA